MALDQESRATLAQLEGVMRALREPRAHDAASSDARLISATIEASALQIIDTLDHIGERIHAMLDETSREGCCSACWELLRR